MGKYDNGCHPRWSPSCYNDFSQAFAPLSPEITPFEHQGFGALRVIVDEETGEPWFVAKDVCDAVGHSNPSMAVSGLDDDEVREHKLYLGSGRKPLLVSEAGLYTLIVRSNKLEVTQFRRWVTHEVLPAIRKHGGYLTPKLTYYALTDPDVIINLA